MVINGNTAYVNNYGAGVNSGLGITVNVVDLLTNSIVGPPITVAQAPSALAITPDGAFVYVACYVNGNPGMGMVYVIQTSDNTVVAMIPGFSGPFGIAITPNGKFAYVTNFGSNNFSPVGNTVSVIDTSTNTITDTITLGTQPAGVAITPDGKFVYVSNYNTLYLGPQLHRFNSWARNGQHHRYSDKSGHRPNDLCRIVSRCHCHGAGWRVCLCFQLHLQHRQCHPASDFSDCRGRMQNKNHLFDAKRSDQQINMGCIRSLIACQLFHLPRHRTNRFRRHYCGDAAPGV